MSIINTYDNAGEAIISPENIVHRIDDFPKTVLVSFNDKFSRLLLQSYNAIFAVDGASHGGCPIPVYKLKYNQTDLAFYCSIQGASLAAALLEEAIAMGGRKFLFFGSCGVLNKSIAEGHYIVPTAAYRDEGTSYHYLPADDYVGIPTANRLINLFEQIGVSCVSGKTWTTDAPYRETRNNMEKRKAEGCIAVEMECAAIMAVAQFKNIEVYQFLFSDDCLDAENWEPRTLLNGPKNLVEQHLQVALKLASKL